MALADILPTDVAGRQALMDTIHARCVDDAGCLRWTDGMSTSGSPQIYIAGAMRSVRKVLLTLHGQPPGSDRRLVALCHTPGCCTRAHIGALTMTEFVRCVTLPKTNQRLRAEKIARGRRKSSRLSDDDVRIVRYGDEPPEVAARRLEVSTKHIREIRAGRARADHTASPWAGMGAR